MQRSSTALLLLATTLKQSHRASHLRIYCLEESASLPAMFEPLFSSTNQQLITGSGKYC